MTDFDHPRTGSLKLEVRRVEKPWGRETIPAFFANDAGDRIGEVWFEHPDGRDLALLAKYIFTSERLSVQVHPDDCQAAARGLARGKTECWYVLDAAPDARLGLGLQAPVTPDELRAAALDGSIEQLLDWKPVAGGDFFFVPAGTVHAIGAGITLLEVQQNSDVTYRLYDYGRPRELHLDEAVAVSVPGPYDDRLSRRGSGQSDALLLDNPAFSVVKATRTEAIPDAFADRMRWVLPLSGQALACDQNAIAGDCLLVAPGEALELSDDALVLVAATGPIS